MKTEDIDKRINMPDVDAEWARFEKEVIGRKTNSVKKIWLGGLSIAASIILATGLFLLGLDNKKTKQILSKVEQPAIIQKDIPSPSETPTELSELPTIPSPSKKERQASEASKDTIVTKNAEEDDVIFSCDEEAERQTLLHRARRGYQLRRRLGHQGQLLLFQQKHLPRCRDLPAWPERRF